MSRREPEKDLELDLADAPARLMPHYVRPMLAVLVDEPFDDPEWLFEVKWDGYRAIAEVSAEGVSLYSRRRQPFERQFSPVIDSLRGLGHEAVIDGEIVVVDEQGRAQFQLLQNYEHTGQGNLIYYVFDIIYFDGHDLRQLPLLRRKELLRRVLPRLSNVRFSDHVEAQGIGLFRKVVARGVEGVVGKRKGSPYREGERSKDWVKIKRWRCQEAVIGGFTEGRGGRKGFGALVLGVYRHGDLIYVGHTGGGFDDKTLADVRARLEGLVQQGCPFTPCPKTNAPARWVKPELVCEVRFSDWTQDGKMRHPIFLGLRPDKRPETVQREEEVATANLLGTVARERRRDSDSANLALVGRSVRVTNLRKVFWPGEGYKKRDVIDYYRCIAPAILPHLHDRPESLHRHPDGIEGDSFFQKDIAGQVPDWVATVQVSSDGKEQSATYLLCQDEATLIYMANLGCIELNPWNSRLAALDNPDYLVLDLDPLGISFHYVIEAALVVRDILEQIGIPSCCKTSGATGLHIYVPLGARYTYDQCRQFGRIIALTAFARLPVTTSLERNPEKRQRKIYLDYLQNRRGATVAAPYCLRPRPGAPVSAPLKWEEVNYHLDPLAFNIKTVPQRLEKIGDIFQPVLNAGINMRRCLSRLEALSSLDNHPGKHYILPNRLSFK